MLALPDPQCPFNLDTEASSVGVAAVPSQEGKHTEQVIAYFSHSLSQPLTESCLL